MGKSANKASDAQKDACRILTPEFRVSYPHVFKAAQVQGKGDPKFSITMLFPKDGDLSVIKAAIRAAKTAEFGGKENWPDALESPVVDGDAPKHANKDGYKGHWVIKAISNEQAKPGLVNEDVEPITNQADFYPGCYARAQVFARVWEYMGKQGVHFILDHVQKTKDGKPFGNRKSAKDVFQPVAKSASADDSDDVEGDDDDGDFM